MSEQDTPDTADPPTDVRESDAEDARASEPQADTPVTAEPRGPGRKVPPRPPPVEDKPIIAGRLWWAILMLIGLGLVANPRFNAEVHRRVAAWRQTAPPEPWKLDGTATVTLTLVTADSLRLACQHRDAVDGARCEYATDRLRTPKDQDKPFDDNNVDRIQPYRTSGSNQLILVAGVWATPEVAYRLHQEPPYGVAVKKLVRFDAECRVRFVGKLDTVKLRWETGAAWQTERGAWVARAESCKVPLVGKE